MNYTEWGEQGCPNSVAHFLGFLEEMQSVHQHSMGEIPPGHNKNPPILVHCTAGVGRTGLTILCDLLLYTVDHNQVRILIQYIYYSLKFLKFLNVSTFKIRNHINVFNICIKCYTISTTYIFLSIVKKYLALEATQKIVLHSKIKSIDNSVYFVMGYMFLG